MKSRVGYSPSSSNVGISCECTIINVMPYLTLSKNKIKNKKSYLKINFK